VGIILPTCDTPPATLRLPTYLPNRDDAPSAERNQLNPGPGTYRCAGRNHPCASRRAAFGEVTRLLAVRRGRASYWLCGAGF
jgi:hypothetical protein